MGGLYHSTTWPILNEAYHVALGLILLEYLLCATYYVKLLEKDMELSNSELNDLAISYSHESLKAAPNSVKHNSKTFIFTLPFSSNFYWPHCSCLDIRGSERSSVLSVHLP